MDAVAALCRDIVRRHGVRPERVLAHSDVAPGRKIDPGEAFPWAWLARQGVGVWPMDGKIPGQSPTVDDASGPAVAALRSDLARWGYDIAPGDALDTPLRVVVEAFQRHFRQARVDGVADAQTVAALADLLRRFGDGA
jgi:N-acetylmuramoyl-L-alanine amidase